MLAQKQTGGRGTRALAASCGPPGTAAVKGPSSSAIHSVVDNQLPQQETLKGECSSALPPKSPAAAGAHGHAASDPGGGINHQERQPWAALSGHRSSPLSELGWMCPSPARTRLCKAASHLPPLASFKARQPQVAEPVLAWPRSGPGSFSGEIHAPFGRTNGPQLPAGPAQQPSWPAVPLQSHLPKIASRSRQQLSPLHWAAALGLPARQIYPIKDPKARTRLALIVCNIEFEHCTRRNGAEIDLAQMTQLLEGLDYKVEVETNLCSQGMADCLKHFAAREEHKASDSTFVVLMSHGLRDGLCGTKSSEQHPDILPVDLVFSTFNNKNCRALRGKPKVIIIQACRGGRKHWAQTSRNGDTLCVLHKQWATSRAQADFVPADNVSWRSPQTGSIFIVQLVEEIKKHAWNCNLEEIFRKVMWAFESNPCQMPSKDRTTLSRKFYLFPGH
uniref:Caspase-1 n=1 Tax=Varanus komodoensis TaxID=61221 RepID=A0A8D2KT29_VARKO